MKICTCNLRAILRTFSCWRFSRKIHLHGFFDKSSDITNFCSDITFFFNNFYTVHASPMMHTNKKLWIVARQMMVPKKCQSGHSKCQKMPKCEVSPVSPLLISRFEHVKRSERSRTIRSKIVSFIWGIQKYNFYTWGKHNKKVDFLGCMPWWAGMKFFIMYISFNYSPRSTSSSGGHKYENDQGAGVYPRYYRRVGLGQWLCQKMPYSEEWVFANQLIFANMWIPRQQRSARSPTIGSKNVSELWRHQKWHWWTSGGPLKKINFFEWRSELISYVVWTFHDDVSHDRAQIAPWVIFIKMNIGQRSNDWVQKT